MATRPSADGALYLQSDQLCYRAPLL